MDLLSTNEGAISIRQPIPIISRILILPLAIAACLLLLFLVTTIGSVVEGAGGSEQIGMQLFCVAGILVLGFPGLIGLFISRSVRIDPFDGLVSEVQDFRLFQRTSCTGLADIDYIAVVSLPTDEDDDSGFPCVPTAYNVSLVRSQALGVIDVATLRSRSEAAELANALSSVLQLAVHDLSDMEYESI